MSWSTVTLRDIGQWYGGGTPAKSNPLFWSDGSIPWLSPKDMVSNTLSATQDHITPAAVQGSSVKLVPPDSVAIVVRSGILERTLPIALVPFETTLNQDMKAVTPREDTDPKWIAWCLRAFERELLRETRKAGTTVASIEMPRFYSFEIPLPSRDEQRQIIGTLEGRLSRLFAADELLSAVRLRLLAFRERLIVATLTGVLTSPSSASKSALEALRGVGTNDSGLPDLAEGWKWARLGEIAEVVGGVTKDTKKQSDPSFVEVPYLRVANVQRGHLDLRSVATIRVPERKAGELKLQKGDILLNEGGDRDKLARGWVWEGQIDNCIHQNHVFRARLSDPKINPYLVSLSANTIGGKWAERNGKQSVNLASISLSTIRKMPIIVPPSEASESLFASLSEDLAAVDRLGSQIALLARKSSSLRQLLLDAAFRKR